jgi:type VI protein secretion system component Hcp
MSRAVNLTIEPDGGSVDLDTFKQGEQDKAKIYISSFELMGQTGVDPKTGRPKGNREYTGIKIRKRLDGASPGLFELFTKNTPFKATFEIAVADFTGSGTPSEVAAVITVGGGGKKNAFVSSYALRVPDVEKPVGDNPEEPYEEIVFSFDGIEFKKSGLNQLGDSHTIVVKDSHSGIHLT